MIDITVKEWVEKIQQDPEAVILDVRTPAEWAEGIQKDAVLINFLDQAEFQEKIKALDTSKHYYIYCRSGGRSAKALKKIKELGFKEVFNLKGGMKAWKAEGRKTTL